jgi:hypothetical protein
MVSSSILLNLSVLSIIIIIIIVVVIIIQTYFSLSVCGITVCIFIYEFVGDKRTSQFVVDVFSYLKN